MTERVCPTCSRPWPKQKGRRFCVECNRIIGRHHHWFIGIDNRPHHYDCDHPSLKPGQPVPDEPSIFMSVRYLDAQGMDVKP